MSEPMIPDELNNNLRKVAGFFGGLLFAVGKAGITAFIKDNYACEWDLEKVRIRKIKQLDGKPGWIVFNPNDRDGSNMRLDFKGEWQQIPHGSGLPNDRYTAEWRDDTEFDSFDEAARLAADVLKNGPGGKT